MINPLGIPRWFGGSDTTLSPRRAQVRPLDSGTEILQGLGASNQGCHRWHISSAARGGDPCAEGGCLHKASHLLPAHVTRTAGCQGACHQHGAGGSSPHLLPAGETATQTAETPLYLSRQQSSGHGVCHCMRKSLLLQRSSETREMEKLGDAL